MEETLGKRIIANRKRLNMTQDKLAEQLGVTAQAVSKWENDQSCPDIAMLPKLAELFGISIDTLLGITSASPAKEAEVVIPAEEEESEPEGFHVQNGNWEFHWGGGKNNRIWFAIWVLLMGGMMLFNVLSHRHIDLWDMAWPSAVLLFGLRGIGQKFSFFKLGCLLFGGYSLLENMEITFLSLCSQVLLPAAVLLFGLSLLADALRDPSKRRLSFTHNGKNPKRSHFEIREDAFDCNLSFGEASNIIDCPRLHKGAVNVSFGELVLNLSGCEEIVPGCHIEANCSFGELTLLVPRRYRVEAENNSSFGNFEIKGTPDLAAAVILLNASVNFGEICVKYI